MRRKKRQPKHVIAGLSGRKTRGGRETGADAIIRPEYKISA